MLLSADEIKQHISDGKIKAISIDTSIFEQKQNGLEYGLLRRMQQFMHGDVTFVLSDVVLHEVRSHILLSAAESQKTLREALKQSGNPWHVTKEVQNDVMQLLCKGETPEDVTLRRIDAYLQSTGALVVKAENYATVTDLVERYFAGKAPFGRSEAKKHEFPDALAVLALEGWAAQNDTMMLVVSVDGDWKHYCSESPRLVAVDDFAKALQLFQRETAQYACQLLSDQLRGPDQLGITQAVEDAIYNQESKFNFDPDAISAFYYDADWPEATLEFIRIHGIDDDKILLEPIEYGDDYLVALIKVDVDANVSCHFSFSVYDSMDKDSVSMGSATVSVTEELVAEVLVTFSGTMPNCTTIEDVEVVEQRVNVNFGEVEPDWRNEDPNDYGD
jgi:hypothetical protein